MASIKIYTDGSCFPNPDGFGGWAYICLLLDDDDRLIKRKIGSGSCLATTNNAMELKAILEGLRALKSTNTLPVTIYTDSTYSKKALTEYVDGWILNQWRTMQGKPVANKELIKEANSRIRNLPCYITFQWVKGHNGDKYNELVDTLAGEERLSISEQTKHKNKTKHNDNTRKRS